MPSNIIQHTVRLKRRGEKFSWAHPDDFATILESLPADECCEHLELAQVDLTTIYYRGVWFILDPDAPKISAEGTITNA